MDGDGIRVEFNGSYLRVLPTNVIERDRFGTGDLVVPVAEIASVTIKHPRLMVDGHLDVSTCKGQAYQLHFTRRQRSDFDSLHRRLLGTIGPAPAVLPPGPVPPDSLARSTAIPAEPLPLERIGTPWLLHTVGYFRQSVVGESYHSDQLERISGPEAAGEKRLVAELRREPRNPHDRDAIQTSARLRALLEPLRDAQVACYAEVELTGNALAAEVRVSLTMPEELRADFVQQVEARLGRS